MIKYRVITDSMEPLIKVGSEITVEKGIDKKGLKMFDILVFNKDHKDIICHYLWHRNELFDKGLIITRCLKNRNFDEPFEEDRIIGRVTNYKISIWMKIKILVADKLSKS